MDPQPRTLMSRLTNPLNRIRGTVQNTLAMLGRRGAQTLPEDYVAPPSLATQAVDQVQNQYQGYTAGSQRAVHALFTSW